MATGGAVIQWARSYDLLIKLLTLGRERAFRERLLQPARIRPGESVLDIGCGTGSLAIAAKRYTGESGSVHGIDPSERMIDRARRKSSRANLDVAFSVGFAQSLPFPAARFDLVLSTVMLHHLPRVARLDALREARRVLKPDGRLFAVDFAISDHGRKGLLGHLHRHGGLKARDLVGPITEAGFTVTDSGPIDVWDLFAVHAVNPRETASAPADSPGR